MTGIHVYDHGGVCVDGAIMSLSSGVTYLMMVS